MTSATASPPFLLLISYDYLRSSHRPIGDGGSHVSSTSTPPCVPGYYARWRHTIYLPLRLRVMLKMDCFGVCIYSPTLLEIGSTCYLPVMGGLNGLCTGLNVIRRRRWPSIHLSPLYPSLYKPTPSFFISFWPRLYPSLPPTPLYSSLLCLPPLPSLKDLIAFRVPLSLDHSHFLHPLLSRSGFWQ